MGPFNISKHLGLRLPLKTEFSLEFFAALNMYYLSFRSFEQLALALKKRVCPENFSLY